MGMNFAPGGGDDQDVVVDINTTPLIDVMLQGNRVNWPERVSCAV